MADRRLEKLARDWTESMFTNGLGTPADRLVLTLDGPPKRDLGGWARGPFCDRLIDLLEAAQGSASEQKRSTCAILGCYIVGEHSHVATTGLRTADTADGRFLVPSDSPLLRGKRR